MPRTINTSSKTSLKTSSSQISTSSSTIPEGPHPENTISSEGIKTVRNTVLQNLTNLKLDAQTKTEFEGYVSRAVMQNRIFSACNDYKVIPSESSKKMLLTKRISNKKSFAYICLTCNDLNTIENMNKVPVDSLKAMQCMHANLSEAVFENTKEGDGKYVSEDKSTIQVLKESKMETLVFVNPAKKYKKNPSILVMSSRTKKFRCDSCKGAKCLHLNLYSLEVQKDCDLKDKRSRLQEKEIENNLLETEVLNSNENLPSKAKEPKEKTTNKLNPFNFVGKEANVFQIKIEYPPSEKDFAEIDKINEGSKNLFPNKVALPRKASMCDCGNQYKQEANPANIESIQMIINHSQEVIDSRNSSLICYYLRTGRCECRLYYTGEEDKLLRVSPIESNSNNQNRPIHFMTYDFMFEYHTMVTKGGTTQNSFVRAKNTLNVTMRGKTKSKIILSTFNKAYEIFIHAIDYDVEEAWNCDECPEPLKEGENEEDFDDIEVHIADGIQEGNLNERLVSELELKMIYEEEKLSGKVEGIEAKDRTFLSNAKERNMIEDIFKNENKGLKTVVSKLKKLKNKSQNLSITGNLLIRLQGENDILPKSYILLFSEI